MSRRHRTSAGSLAHHTVGRCALRLCAESRLCQSHTLPSRPHATLAGMVSEADIDLSVVTKYFIFQVGRWRRC